MTNSEHDTNRGWSSIIGHVDLDCFFAQAEMLDDPSLRGQPVIVGPTPPVRRADGTFEPVGRGIVCTANYEARAFGVKTAMPAAQAQRLCPHARFIKPRGERYQELSHQVFEALGELTPVVRPVGIDEAYLDLAGLEQSFVQGEQRDGGGAGGGAGGCVNRGSGEGGAHGATEERASWVRRFAERVQSHVLERVGLDISVGIGPNRFIAKLASDYNKPRGVHVVEPQACAAFCRSLDIRDLRGVGPATAERLAAMGFRTPSHLIDAPREQVIELLGESGQKLWDAMHGAPGTVPAPDEQRKSISRDRTFSANVSTGGAGRESLASSAAGLLERAMHTLRREALMTRTVGVRVRFADFETVQHDVSLSRDGGPGATDLDCDVIPRLPELIDACLRRATDAQRRAGVRLIGVKLSNLTPHASRQASLFEAESTPERSRVYEAMDAIRAKLGHGAVGSARSLGARERRVQDPAAEASPS